MKSTNASRRRVIAALAAFTAATTVPMAHGQENVVNIGFASPLTGAAASYGKDNELGARLAIEEANAQKLTINGKPVTFNLVVKDDQGDPRIAVQSAQNLVDAKVVAVIGHTTSGCSIPASAIYEKAGIPMLVPSASNPKLTQQGYKNVFRVYGTDDTIAQRAASYAVDTMKLKRIAVVDDRTAYGQGLAEEFEKGVKSHGGAVVAREFTTDQAMDFRAILTNIRAAKADVVFFAGLGAQGATFIKQARQLGYRGQIMAGATFANRAFIDMAGAAANGMIAVEHGVAIDSLPKGQDFSNRFKKRFGTNVIAYAPFSYDAAWVAIKAMQRANSTDPKIFGPLVSKTDVEGVIGNIRFDNAGDMKNPKTTIFVVKDNAWDALSTAAK